MNKNSEKKGAGTVTLKNDFRVYGMPSFTYFLKKIDSDKNIITDKAPLNFKWIGFLLITFPNCKIIHSIRNPMDICWSMYKNYFPSKRLNFSYSLDNLGSYYLLYKNMMDFWNNTFKDRIYNIEYENLIKNNDWKLLDNELVDDYA